MTREDVYILIGRLEWFVADLNVCLKYNTQPVFRDDDEGRECGDYAERICAYVRATNDEQVMIDCCKINRYNLYMFGNNTDDIGRAIIKARRYLMMIHDYALSKIWGISQDDIKNCTYYVNSVEGVCRNSATGELLPRPIENKTLPICKPSELDTPGVMAIETMKKTVPQKGMPSELDTPEANKYFPRAIAAGMMRRSETGGKWLCQIARLGYLCSKVFDAPRPIAALEKYFNVTKLSASITQAGYEAKRADVKKWRADIDSKIFYD